MFVCGVVDASLPEHLIESCIMVLRSRLTNETPALQFLLLVPYRAVGLPPQLEVDDCACLRFSIPEYIAQPAVHGFYALSVDPSGGNRVSVRAQRFES